MPCRAKHLKIGALVGAVGGGLYSAVRQYEAVKDIPSREFDVAEVIWDSAKGGAAGAFAGTLPDILEPPATPNHRGIFHSFPLLAVIVFAVTLLFARSKTALLGLIFSSLSATGLTCGQMETLLKGFHRSTVKRHFSPVQVICLCSGEYVSLCAIGTEI